MASWSISSCNCTMYRMLGDLEIVASSGPLNADLADTCRTMCFLKKPKYGNGEIMGPNFMLISIL